MKTLLATILLAASFSVAAEQESLFVKDGYAPWLSESGVVYFFSSAGKTVNFNHAVCRSRDPNQLGKIRSTPARLSPGGLPLSEQKLVDDLKVKDFEQVPSKAHLVSAACEFGNATFQAPVQKGESI